MNSRIARTDIATAVVLTAVGLLEAVLGVTSPTGGLLPVLLVPVVTVPVAARGARPAAALLVMLGALVLQAALGSDLPGGFTEPIALVLVLYSVGSHLPLRPGLALLATGAAGIGTVIALGPDPHAGNFVYAATLLVAGWGAGRVVHLAGERTALLAERHAQQERSRIARELHDVVSHHVSAVVVQAAARRRDLDPTDPTTTVLTDIEQQGRETLQELRRLLGLLRIDDDAHAPLAPQPGLDDLPRLVETMRGQGIDVSWTSTGDPQPVGVGLQLAVYRVVQEALTNVRKHAGDQRAHVVLAWRPDGVEVEVVSGGETHGRRLLPGSGFGLRSMAERVQAYGGELTARRTTDGFRVHAALPLDAR